MEEKKSAFSIPVALRDNGESGMLLPAAILLLFFVSAVLLVATASYTAKMRSYEALERHYETSIVEYTTEPARAPR